MATWMRGGDRVSVVRNDHAQTCAAAAALLRPTTGIGYTLIVADFCYRLYAGH